MKRFIFLTLAIPTFVSVIFCADSQLFQAVGSFSNMRFTEEHQYGTAVDLWRQGDEFVGILYNAQGLQGGTPRGILEDIHFDPASHAISFKAKLSMGVIQQDDPTSLRVDHKEWVRSRDLFVFKGVLKDTALVGDLGIGDGFYSDPTPTASSFQHVDLIKEKGIPYSPVQAQNITEWKKKITENQFFKPAW